MRHALLLMLRINRCIDENDLLIASLQIVWWIRPFISFMHIHLPLTFSAWHYSTRALSIEAYPEMWQKFREVFFSFLDASNWEEKENQCAKYFSLLGRIRYQENILYGWTEQLWIDFFFRNQTSFSMRSPNLRYLNSENCTDIQTSQKFGDGVILKSIKKIVICLLTLPIPAHYCQRNTSFWWSQLHTHFSIEMWKCKKKNAHI